MPEKRVLSEAEFMAEFWRFYKAKKGIHMLGWALLLIPTAAWRRETPREMRDRLIAEGRAQSAVYRALADFRALGKHLEDNNMSLPEWEKEELQDVTQRVVQSVERVS